MYKKKHARAIRILAVYCGRPQIWDDYRFHSTSYFGPHTNLYRITHTREEDMRCDLLIFAVDRVFVFIDIYLHRSCSHTIHDASQHDVVDDGMYYMVHVRGMDIQ